MSRCVPFPPPGYSWNGLSDEALVDLLKVRQEMARAEKETRKGEKRRKKEKKRKRHCNGRSKTMHESRGLESSGLTEEAELPASPDSQYDSSDNSHNNIVTRELLKSASRPVSQIETQFRELIVNWVPPLTQCYHNTELDDQSWLYDRKLAKAENTKGTEDDDLCHRSLTASSTCAFYLPQADVHVLPFTLLF